MLYPTYKINKPIRLISLFSGYDSQALALKYLGVNYEHYKTCEWAVKSIQALKDLHFENDNTDYSKDLTDKEIKEYLLEKGISSNYNDPMTESQVNRLSYKQARNIYNNIKATNNLVNIQQVKGTDLCIKDTDKFTYLLTYSFPCQDLSLAGKGKGMSDTSTRSGMLWEVERILTELEEKPQILLMENVPQVHGEGNIEDFNKWQLRLEELGYKNYCQDLIATDYGIPQTRNRCFMVSILGDYNYTFPKPIPLKLKLKDMLEDNVPEKYYLSDKMLEYCLGVNQKESKFPRGERFLQSLQTTNEKGLATTISTNAGNRPVDNFIKEENLKTKLCNDLIKENIVKGGEIINHSYTTSEHRDTLEKYIETDNGISPTLTTRADILGVVVNDDSLKIRNATKKGYLEATEGDGIDISSRMEYHRGTVQKDKAQTLSTMGGENVGVISKDLRIRKLTPKECFRLMGVKDEDFEKVAKNQSDNSLYHLAGDSIVVNVLMAIFKEML